MTNEQINNIFFPHYTKQTDLYRKSGFPFAYYTNADTALKILRSESIWMRKPSMMNDYSEIEHGYECLNEVLISEIGEHFKQTLDQIHPDISTQIANSYASIHNNIKASTFISCFTKHSTALENDLGRLSMWRAYGKNNGIAFIFKPELFFNSLNAYAVGVISSPVAYFTPTEIGSYLEEITTNIKNNFFDLKTTTSRDELCSLILVVYTMAIICNKHNGFLEEAEWRAITYSPYIETSTLLRKTIEVINGTPQAVQNFNFKNVPEKGITGLSLLDLLKRIIIGPCEHPEVTKEALTEELSWKRTRQNKMSAP